MNIIETFEVGKLKVNIYPDEGAESPREWGNLGVMACFHKRYGLGDKDHGIRHEDYSGWDEMEAAIRKDKGAVVILPLFPYDHSGLRMKVGSFAGLLPQGHAEFDSGQVGFIYATRESVLKEYSTKRITKKMLKKVEGILQSEVETFDQYLSGDVYGFCVEDADGNDLNSCWGHYGLEYCKGEARRSAEAIAKKGAVTA